VGAGSTAGAVGAGSTAGAARVGSTAGEASSSQVQDGVGKLLQLRSSGALASYIASTTAALVRVL
jgi:hypothetical protein